ncbi:MAG: hypothetical protein IPJ88_00830 [Myxococcales bacterium]|nr:MAG: hypothetical protein IPJ88_00830 [Myxococcales bacterium]
MNTFKHIHPKRFFARALSASLGAILLFNAAGCSNAESVESSTDASKSKNKAAKYLLIEGLCELGYFSVFDNYSSCPHAASTLSLEDFFSLGGSPLSVIKLYTHDGRLDVTEWLIRNLNDEHQFEDVKTLANSYGSTLSWRDIAEQVHPSLGDIQNQLPALLSLLPDNEVANRVRSMLLAAFDKPSGTQKTQAIVIPGDELVILAALLLIVIVLAIYPVINPNADYSGLISWFDSLVHRVTAPSVVLTTSITIPHEQGDIVIESPEQFKELMEALYREIQGLSIKLAKGEATPEEEGRYNALKTMINALFDTIRELLKSGELSDDERALLCDALAAFIDVAMSLSESIIEVPLAEDVEPLEYNHYARSATASLFDLAEEAYGFCP